MGNGYFLHVDLCQKQWARRRRYCS